MIFYYSGISLVFTSPSYPKREEESGQMPIGPFVPVHYIVRTNQMHGIKSYDCAGMKGMQINDCAHVIVPEIAPVQWNVSISYSRTPEIRDIMDPIRIWPDPFSPRV